jgi:hypothetical protein
MLRGKWKLYLQTMDDNNTPCTNNMMLLVCIIIT